MILGELHKHQRDIFLDPSRIRVLACGARWGKDRLTLFDMLMKLQWMARVEKTRRRTLIPAVLAWYVAPNYSLLRQAWEELQHYTADVPGVRYNQGKLQCFIPGGIEIEFKSADNPGSLLSRGLDYIAVTEAARMKKEAWQKSLVTRLSSPGRGPGGCGGLALLNSTPEGQNWYYDLWKSGQTCRDGYIKSWQYSSYDNPYIDPSQLDRHRQLLPDRVFRQEYMAEFVSGGGGVFRRLAEAWQEYSFPQLPDPDEWGVPYTIGVDWGRHTDSTVLTVIRHDPDRCVLVNHRRLTDIGYADQIAAIADLCSMYPGAEVIPESNGLGDPLIEQLRSSVDAPIQPFATTAVSKKNIIETLSYIIETGGLMLPAVSSHGVLQPAIPELMDELSAYEATTRAGGIVTYGAPQGRHDDCVMSLAFAVCGKNVSSARTALKVVRS